MSGQKMGSKTHIFAMAIGTTPEKIVGNDPKRTGIRIHNDAECTLYILSRENQTCDDGIPVAGDKWYKNNTTTAELWGVCDGSGDVRVQVDSE